MTTANPTAVVLVYLQVSLGSRTVHSLKPLCRSLYLPCTSLVKGTFNTSTVVSLSLQVIPSPTSTSHMPKRASCGALRSEIAGEETHFRVLGFRVFVAGPRLGFLPCRANGPPSKVHSHFGESPTVALVCA